MDPSPLAVEAFPANPRLNTGPPWTYMGPTGFRRLNAYMLPHGVNDW